MTLRRIISYNDLVLILEGKYAGKRAHVWKRYRWRGESRVSVGLIGEVTKERISLKIGACKKLTFENLIEGMTPEQLLALDWILPPDPAPPPGYLSLWRCPLCEMGCSSRPARCLRCNWQKFNLLEILARAAE